MMVRCNPRLLCDHCVHYHQHMEAWCHKHTLFPAENPEIYEVWIEEDGRYQRFCTQFQAPG